MRTWMLRFTLVTLAVASAAPLEATAGGKQVARKVIDKLKRNRAGLPARKVTPKTSRTARIRGFLGRRVASIRGHNQHAFMPMSPGDERVYAIESGNGTSTMTQRVVQVQARSGVRQSEIEQTWGGGHTDRFALTVSREGLTMKTASRIGGPALYDVSEGVGLPRNLKVGKTWSNRLEWTVEGSVNKTRTTSEVVGKVRRAGPDGVMRDGFVVESRTVRTTTFRGETGTRVDVERAVYLNGLGEVEHTNRTEGEKGSVTRRLVGFTSGGDPG
jgi:hypothetical protein